MSLDLQKTIESLSSVLLSIETEVNEIYSPDLEPSVPLIQRAIKCIHNELSTKPKTREVSQNNLERARSSIYTITGI
jgi:hypothetical protein